MSTAPFPLKMHYGDSSLIAAQTGTIMDTAEEIRMHHANLTESDIEDMIRQIEVTASRMRIALKRGMYRDSVKR